jgi:hypothetical protein
MFFRDSVNIFQCFFKFIHGISVDSHKVGLISEKRAKALQDITNFV